MSKSGSSSSSSGGIGFCGLLFIVFLVMKLAKIGGVENWSWLWVCAPLWIPALLALAVFGIIFLVAYFAQK